MITWIDLMLADHRRVEELFASFESSPNGVTVGQIVDALTVHDQAEHNALYPIAAEVLDDPDMVLRMLDAHSAVKTQIERLGSLEGEPLVAAVQDLRRLVELHVQDEEKHLVPALRKRCTPAQTELLTARFEQAKQRVG